MSCRILLQWQSIHCFPPIRREGEKSPPYTHCNLRGTRHVAIGNRSENEDVDDATKIYHQNEKVGQPVANYFNSLLYIVSLIC